MKKLLIPLFCFLLLTFVSSTGARMPLPIVGGGGGSGGGVVDYTTDANCQGAYRMDGDDVNDEEEPDESTNSYDLDEETGEEIAVASVRPSGYSGDSRLFVSTDTAFISCPDTSTNCAGLDISGANQDLTMCVWINAQTANTSTYYYVGGKYKAATGKRQYAINLYGNPSVNMRFLVRNSADDTTYVATSTTSVSTSTWYHVCGVYDDDDTDNELKIYVNGGSAEDTTDTNSEGIASGSADVDFCWGAAGCGDTAETFFDGYIFQGIVFDRALSQAEIQNIYDDGMEGVNGSY
jgi:hypothetical protein